MRYLWALLGLLCVALGLIGIVLPLLPTVPFMLLAAFFFARSSERLHHWLITHPTFGPPIVDWQEHGAISRRAKYLATGSILATVIISAIVRLPPLYLGIQIACLIGVTTFIWTRPDA